MSAFKVGDKVRVIRKSAYGTLQVGAVHKVLDVRSHSIKVDASPIGSTDSPSQYWNPAMFELVEPAEVEQATAILDGQQDDGWWDLDLAEPVSLLNTSVPMSVKDLRKWSGRLGLEVRVQVRRVQS